MRTLRRCALAAIGITSSILATRSNIAEASSSVVHLTPENYDELTEGKAVFLKFFAPWCGHCKKMSPDWEKLSSDWEGSDIGLIAAVDCTAGGKDLCDTNNIEGFPTLKYGDPNYLETYSGGRDYDSLKRFADENLKAVCSPSKLDLCGEEEKAEIDHLMKMDADGLDAKIKAEEKKIEEAEIRFKEEVEKLQNAYRRITEEKEKKIADVKKGGLGVMKSVRRFISKKDAAKDEL